jgi:hypothetical protein
VNAAGKGLGFIIITIGILLVVASVIVDGVLFTVFTINPETHKTEDIFGIEIKEGD